jgi:hypothetical protein
MGKVPHVDADNDLQMARKKERPLDSEPAVADESPRKTVIRVRRGALRRFDQLKQKSADLPVEIKWDRRLSERRADSEAETQDTRPATRDQRKKDRRKTPPFT